MCLYIKAATLPLQHLATISSPIRRHRLRRVLLRRRRRRHPPRPQPSMAPPVLCPTGFSAAVGLSKSAVTLTHRHTAGPPPSTPGTRATSSPTCPGLPGLRRRRAVLLLCAVLPGLRGSAAAVSSSYSAPSSPASGALPCALPPAVLSIVASSCTVVLSTSVGAPPADTNPCQGHSCPPKLGLADASKLIICVSIF
jgi:hypothetical protein